MSAIKRIVLRKKSANQMIYLFPCASHSLQILLPVQGVQHHLIKEEDDIHREKYTFYVGYKLFSWSGETSLIAIRGSPPPKKNFFKGGGRWDTTLKKANLEFAYLKFRAKLIIF